MCRSHIKMQIRLLREESFLGQGATLQTAIAGLCLHSPSDVPCCEHTPQLLCNKTRVGHSRGRHTIPWTVLQWWSVQILWSTVSKCYDQQTSFPSLVDVLFPGMLAPVHFMCQGACDGPYVSLIKCTHPHDTQPLGIHLLSPHCEQQRPCKLLLSSRPPPACLSEMAEGGHSQGV